MAERPKAMPNRIAEGVVEQLRLHARDYPYLWARLPATLARGVGAGWEQAPKPAIYVTSTSGDLTEREFGAQEWHRSRLELRVLMMTEDTSDPEGAIEDLVADVRRALMANRQLSGIDGADPVLGTGYLALGGVTRAADLDEGGSGLSVAFQELIAEYQWTNDAP